MKNWLSLCVSKPVMHRAVLTAVIVGSILIAINHGDALLRGQVDTARAWRIALTVVIPYLVSTVSSVATLIEVQKPHHTPERIAEPDAAENERPSPTIFVG